MRIILISLSFLFRFCSQHFYYFASHISPESFLFLFKAFYHKEALKIYHMFSVFSTENKVNVKLVKTVEDLAHIKARYSHLGLVETKNRAKRKMNIGLELHINVILPKFECCYMYNVCVNSC